MYKHNNLYTISAPTTPRDRAVSTKQPLPVTPDRAANIERISRTKDKLLNGLSAIALAEIDGNIQQDISLPITPKHQDSSTNQQLTSAQVTPDRAGNLERLRDRTEYKLAETRLASVLRNKNLANIENCNNNIAKNIQNLMIITVAKEIANRELINAAEAQAALEITDLMLMLAQQAADRYVIEAAEHQELVNIDNLMLLNKKQISSRAIIKAVEKQDYLNIIYLESANGLEIAKFAAIEAKRQQAGNPIAFQFSTKILHGENDHLSKPTVNGLLKNN